MGSSQINKTETSAYNVSLHCPVEPDPLKHAKSLVVTKKTEIYHISDYESHEPIHERRFIDTIDKMKKRRILVSKS